ncbi:MAG: transposase, partial [Desulfuromonadaceae bacterium]
MPKFKQLKPQFKAPSKHIVRKNLNMDAMMATTHNKFANIPDHRKREGKISLPDALMSGYAMFALKDQSLLHFDNRRKENEGNFKLVFGIQNVPSDTQMREILDPIDPDLIRPLFSDIFYQLQRGKALEPLAYYQGCYLLSIDGTGSFSSEKLRSAFCLEKKSRNGKIIYYQQVLGAAIVHPDYREVVPLAPEMIVKQDGAAKNDCERNAAKRFLQKVRQDHPRLGLIVIEDGLSSNAPHIRDLQAHDMHYILGAKEGDHPLLFHTLEEAAKRGEAVEFNMIDEKNPKITHRFRFLNGVPLNQTNMDLKVNVLEYWEVSDKKTLHFAWVTDFTISRDNACILMRGGRARWKIENETFNTLKNQGYNFEHNYGLGKEHLSEVFVMLMMLAFLVDQTQQLTSSLFKAAWAKLGTKRALWENVRNLFHSYEVESMEMIYRAIVNGYRKSGLDVYD